MSQPTLIDVALDLREGDEIVIGRLEWCVIEAEADRWLMRDWRGQSEWRDPKFVRWILRDGGIVLRDGKQVAL